MTLINESQIENPEGGTIGLTSATQLIDFTGSNPSATVNTSLTSLNYIQSLPFQVEEEPSPSRKEEYKTKDETFRENLRKAMRMNAEILKDLARY